MASPQEIVDNMLKNDAFSQWLGIELISIGEGTCKLSLTTRAEMLNGFHILHGGISYSLADSALAFAANSYGQHALSLETSISHHEKVGVGEKIFAEAHLIHKGKKISSFRVEIVNQQKELVASFKGTVFNSSRIWEF